MLNWLSRPRKHTGYTYLLLAIVATIPIWVVRFPPSQDYPNHLLEAYFFAEPGDVFVVKWRPIPYWTVVLTLFVLSRITPWLIAGKILLSLSVFTFLVGGYYFFTQVDRRLGVWAWFLVIIAYNGFFMSGVVNYYLALGLSLFAMGYWYARKEGKNGWDYWGMLVLCTLLYLTHVIPFLMALSCSLLSIVVRSIGRRKKLFSPLLWKASLCFSPGAILFLVYLGGNAQSSVIGPFPSLAERIFVSIQTLLIHSVEAIPETIFPAILQNGVRLALLTFILGSSIWSWLQTKKRDESSEVASPTRSRRGEQLILFCFSFLLWLVAPTGVSDFLRFDQRLFPYILLWGLCLLGPISSRIRPFVQSILAIGACVSLALTILIFVRADRVFREYDARLSRLPSGGTVLSLTEYYPSPPDSILGMLTPQNQVPYGFGCYYPLIKKGIYPAVFDIGPVGLQQDIPVFRRTWELGKGKRFDFSCMQFINEEMDTMRPYYTIVLLWGQPCIDAGDQLESYGYHWFATHREMSIWVRSDLLNGE